MRPNASEQKLLVTIIPIINSAKNRRGIASLYLNANPLSQEFSRAHVSRLGSDFIRDFCYQSFD